MALTDWEIWALLSSDQGKSFGNKIREDRVMKMVEWAAGTDGTKGEPGPQCGTGDAALGQVWRESEKNNRDQTTISVSMRLNFTERWDFPENWHKVTEDRSAHESCGWFTPSARASLDLHC